MPRLGVFTAIVLPLFALGACGRQPCNEDESGPTVRLDVAFGECNFAPVGSIEAPTLTVKGGPTILDGSKSFDLNVEDNLRFTWTLLEKPETSTAELLTPTEVQASFLADAGGAYEIQLVVSDGTRSSEPVSVRIRNENARPVASAGANQMVDPGVTVTLDGSASSDEDGDALLYAWTITNQPGASVATLDDPTSIRPSFVADVRGIYEFSLTVDDGTAQSEVPATVRVNAGVSSNPPVANAGPDRTVDLGRMVVLNAGGSLDPDGDPLVYEWRLVQQPPTSAAVLLNGDQVTSGFTADRVGEYLVTLTVDDGFFRANDTATFTVDPVPHPGVFDPDGVYVPGSTPFGLGVCSIDDGSVAVTMPRGQKFVRRTDGALIYWATNRRIFQFVPDLATIGPGGVVSYDPEDPFSNDIELDTSGCASGVPQYEWRLHPVTGELFFKCAGQLMTATGTVARCFNTEVLALGDDGSVMCGGFVEDPAGTANVFQNTDGSFLTRRFYHGRPRPGGGYWGLYVPDVNPRRWAIEADGSTRLDVNFGPMPAGYVPIGDSVLDATGALMRIARDTTTQERVVVRFEGPGPGTIVFADSEACALEGDVLAIGL